MLTSVSRYDLRLLLDNLHLFSCEYNRTYRLIMAIHFGNEASENMRYLLHWKFFSPRFVEFQIVLSDPQGGFHFWCLGRPFTVVVETLES